MQVHPPPTLPHSLEKRILAAMKALILIADGFDDVQLFCPWYRLQEEGVEVTLASPGGHPVTGQHGYHVEPDMPIHDLNPSEYDLLLIPGGAGPEKLRQREEAVDLARTFMEDGRLVAAIGHGPQLLISAQALDGRAVTCAPGIRDDVRAAGASYRDEAVVAEGHLITGRNLADLPQFLGQIVAALSARAS
jgi:protease I